MFAFNHLRQREPQFRDLLPYGAMVDDGVMLLKDGSLMAGWYFAGADGENATAFKRNDISRQLGSAMTALGPGWMIQVEAIRMPALAYPRAEQSHFPDPVSLAIDEEQRISFEGAEAGFENQYAMILTYRTQRQGGRNQFFFADPGWLECFGDRMLDYFTTAIAEFEQVVADIVSLRRMRTRGGDPINGQALRYDDLLQFVRMCLTGAGRAVQLPDVPMYLDHLLAPSFQHGQVPVIDGYYVNAVAIDGFPSENWLGLLQTLNRLPLSCRWSLRYVLVDADDKSGGLIHDRRNWRERVRPFMDLTSGSNSMEQPPLVTREADPPAEEGEEAEPETYGTCAPVIVLFDTDPKRGRKRAEDVRRVIQDDGFHTRIEDLNITDAFLGSLPGNWYSNARETVISTARFVSMIPLNSVWLGERECPCPLYPPHSPPLMQLVSGAVPFRLNLHVGDSGHTLLIGPPGSGKSTLLALIAAQFRRYADAQVFCFDHSRAMLPMTAALGGQHLDAGSALTLCPLSELDSDADRVWAAKWLEFLLEVQGVHVSPEHRDAIATQIKAIADERNRSLSAFVRGVGNQEIRDALAHYTADGPLGHLLDAEQDYLKFSNLMCFDIGMLMNMGDGYLLPVLYYLFRRIERQLTGEPSLIILDGAWLTLDHEVLGEWLNLLRKANCAAVMATKSIANVAKFGVVDVLKEACLTRIYLANGEATDPETRAFYQKFDFSEESRDAAAPGMKRDYYVVSPSGRRMFHLGLGPLTLSFAGANSDEDIERVNALRREHGSDWPAAWLKERGVPFDADAFRMVGAEEPSNVSWALNDRLWPDRENVRHMTDDPQGDPHSGK
ncbi:MAG: conjugal transfer protein TrbE [Alphaproteobacteria bacterium]|nr:conjugal transfer protein TrbE [Alphaproteobacteria bacterium]